MNRKKLGRMAAAGLIVLLLLAGLPLIARPAQAATHTVTNTNDSGPGSLRQALINANNPGPDTIAFNIPKTDGGYSSSDGVWTITPNSLLPSLTGGDTIIDGATQTTNQGDTNITGPEIKIDGWNIGANGWVFSIESNANQILGLNINGGRGAGVKLISGAAGNIVRDNYIGVESAGWGCDGNGTGIELFGGANGNVIAHNVIGCSTRHGIMIAGSGTDGNMIRRNYIGVDSAGTGVAYNVDHGVLIMNGAFGNTVGGKEGYRNYIGANLNHGVYISGANTNNVTHNYIGLDATGTGLQDVGNTRSGVVVDGGGVSNWIAYNVISGNDEHGVLIEGSGTDYNYVRGNVIGADANVTKPIPNGMHGVGIYGGAQRNQIGDSFDHSWGNVVVGNGWSGVVVVGAGSDYNTVAHNAIGTNQDGSAINLGNNYYGVHVVDGANNAILLNRITRNGAHASLAGVRVEGATAIGNTISRNSIHENIGFGIELVNGGNANLARPSITHATCQQVEGTTGAGWTVEVFSDLSVQGRIYEGSTTAHAIMSSFSWSGNLSGPNVTVTATDAQGNTSEFSWPFYLGFCHKVFLPLVVRLFP
jgi:hypothetical protein